jgi:type VI secretion system VasD/TssJ family lipoprotein
MKKILKCILMVSLILSFWACASKPPRPASWDYEKDAISIRLSADERLNLYQGIPHALLVCIYNLRDPNAFNQVKEEPEGISKLLECSKFDPGVTYYKSIVIQPGQQLHEVLDRAEGTRYVGVVAGYYVQNKDQVIFLYKIPVVEEKRKGELIERPAKLSLSFHLGPQEIQEVKEK